MWYAVANLRNSTSPLLLGIMVAFAIFVSTSARAPVGSSAALRNVPELFGNMIQPLARCKFRKGRKGLVILILIVAWAMQTYTTSGINYYR